MNNYETMAACVERCVGDWSELVLLSVNHYNHSGKYFQCSLGRKPIFNSNMSAQCPVSDTGDGCESDAATCVNFYTMGLCCNKTVETGLSADKSSTCSSGKPRYQVDGLSLLAKVCDDLTCPRGFSCEQGNFFAFCCED